MGLDGAKGEDEPLGNLRVRQPLPREFDQLYLACRELDGGPIESVDPRHRSALPVGVLDALLTRPDVDPERVAVIGIGHGGYLVARALCFEHRCAAAVVHPGIVDLASSWTNLLTGPMREQLESADRQSFDREMHLAELFSPTLSATLQLRGRPYGTDHSSRFDLYQTVSAYRLDDELSRITTPCLITDPQGESPWSGQAKRLADRLPATKTLLRLTPTQQNMPIFDWLKPHLRGDGDRQ